MSERCGVYFLRCGRFVKIGISINIEQRVAEIGTMNPLPLRLVRVELVSSMDMLAREMRLHDRFAEYRHKGEWFHVTGELAEYLASGSAEEVKDGRSLSDLRRERFGREAMRGGRPSGASPN